MSRTKSPQTTDELLKQITELPFEERFQLFEQIRSNIQAEALSKKQEGEKASKILESITDNGK